VCLLWAGIGKSMLPVGTDVHTSATGLIGFTFDLQGRIGLFSATRWQCLLRRDRPSLVDTQCLSSGQSSGAQPSSCRKSSAISNSQRGGAATKGCVAASFQRSAISTFAFKERTLTHLESYAWRNSSPPANILTVSSTGYDYKK
jgi:hypothetical protein